jgi:hypothetical protein
MGRFAPDRVGTPRLGRCRHRLEGLQTIFDTVEACLSAAALPSMQQAGAWF